MRIIEKYNLSPISELFNEFITPEQLREELIEIAFDYAQYLQDEKTDFFKKNSTLYMLCNALWEVIEAENSK